MFVWLLVLSVRANNFPKSTLEIKIVCAATPELVLLHKLLDCLVRLPYYVLCTHTLMRLSSDKKNVPIELMQKACPYFYRTQT